MSRTALPRWIRVCSIVLPLLAGIIGCDAKPNAAPKGAIPASPSAASDPAGTPEGESAARPLPFSHSDLFSARHRAWLHAERDSAEGYEAALAILEELISRPRPDPIDRLNWVRAQLRRSDTFAPGDAERLRAQLDEVHTALAGKTPPDVDFLTAVVALRDHDPAAALPAITRVTEARPDFAPAWYLLGRVRETAGDFAEARDAFRRLIAIDEDHRAGLYHLMLSTGRLGEEEESERIRARFAATPSEDQPDPERCVFTEVSFRPPVGLASIGTPSSVPLELRFELSSEWTAPPRSTHFVPQGVHPPESGVWGIIGEAFSIGRGDGPARVVGDRPAEAVAWGALDPEGTRGGLVAGAGELRELRRNATGEITSVPLSVEVPPDVRSLQLADFDHDGDLDAIVLAATITLLRNDGDGVWAPLPALSGNPRLARGPVRAALDDFDEGNDLDLAFPSEEGVELYWNRRDHWGRQSLPELANRPLLFAEDFDGDGVPELLGLGGRAGWTHVRVSLRESAAVSPEGSVPSSATVLAEEDGPLVIAAAIGDLDNDGDLDLVISDRVGIQWLRNDRGKFSVAGTISVGGSGDPQAVDGHAIDLHCTDLDGDRHLEVLALGSDGVVRSYRSSGAESNEAWILSLDGRRDSPAGIGCVVEQLAGTLWQTRMVKEPGGLHLGLGARSIDAIDGIRLRWPAGIIQALPADRFTIEPDRTAQVRQKEGLVASCPFLFARSGDGWHFVTDILGIAPLDEWRPPGAPSLLDPQEHVLVPGEKLSPVDGFLELAITEELREVTYLDAIELRAVDHPVGTVLHADESTTQGGIVPLRVLVVPSDGFITPEFVHTENDRTADEKTVAIDGVFLHPARSGPPQLAGWTEPQRIQIAPLDARWLLITGRVAWYDSTAVYALHPSGRHWQPPRLEGVDHRGERSVLVEEVGLPAGLDRTVLVELPERARTLANLELVVQHRFLIDRIAAARSAESVKIPEGESTVLLADGGALEVRSARLAHASLGFHGYSREIGDVARHEQVYDLEGSEIAAPWPRIRGAGTAHGDVRKAVGAFDDRLVILLPGERVDLRFEALPLPAPGSTRTWFLTVSGWAKETSFHGRTGMQVGPLPTRAMTEYPPR